MTPYLNAFISETQGQRQNEFLTAKKNNLKRGK
jgi:hypothetical protein